MTTLDEARWLADCEVKEEPHMKVTPYTDQTLIRGSITLDQLEKELRQAQFNVKTLTASLNAATALHKELLKEFEARAKRIMDGD